MHSSRSAFRVFAFFLFSCSVYLPACAFELKDGDRVVLLGDGLAEQEQYYGWVELALTTAFPNDDITFRNLGWNGDTPAGASRFGLSLLQAGREPKDEGWRQLQKQLELTQPTVVILAYGMASALDGGINGLPQFQDEFLRLLKTCRRISPEVRFVFCSPVQPLHTDEFANPTSRVNLAQAITAYSQVIEDIAGQYEAPFVNLTTVASTKEARKDAIHVNSAGYREVAEAISKSLGLPDSEWQSSPHTPKLRQAILRKNEWWFHRSRPANMAYVFGFRKREQGQNAVEIPQFDSLINEEERRIAALRNLRPNSIESFTPEFKSKYAEFSEQPIPEFAVADELEITLWAQNPDLNKPIHMNFDPRGRLWVASSEAYPMIEVGQSAPDKIVVLEDTNNDGRADSSSVFAEGLLIPTGIAPGNGGVYVAQSTDLLFLQDTNGDGKADSKTRVLSGFGTEDTHHNLHSLRWGHDGRLYMNQSVYTRTDAETPFGVARLKAGGGFRFDTRSKRMEVFFRGLWNSWGHQFDAFGQSFLSDGAGFSGLAYAFPGATFNPTPNAREVLDLISPGRWPKFASLEIIQGNAYPPEWQGSIVTCDFRANRVTRFSLTEQGAGFVTQQEDDLVRTSAATFRPIDVKQGPDGALYIADWSNPIINHGEVDFRDPRRDRWHGRIWRVSWKKAKPTESRNLETLATADLLDTLKSADRATRDLSRRVLFERQESLGPALDAWLPKQDAATSRLEALWLRQGLNQLDKTLLTELLSAEDHRIRTAATRVLACWCDIESQPAALLNLEEAMPLLAQQAYDSHPRVRLEAIRGLSRLQNADAAIFALHALDLPMDRFLSHALALTVHETEDLLMEAIEQGALQEAKDATKLEFVLTRVTNSLASQYLSDTIAARPIPANGSGAWIELIGKVGDTPELTQLFDQTLQGGFDEPSSVRALKAITSAQRLRKLKPSGELNRAEELLHHSSKTVQAATFELLEAWRLRSAAESILRIATDDETSPEIRLAAVKSLGTLGNSRVAQSLLTLSNSPNQAIASQAVISIAKLAPQLAVEPAVAALAKTNDEQAAIQLWRKLLAVRGFGKRLSRDLDAATLSQAAIQAGLRATKDAGRQEKELQNELEALGTSATATNLSRDQMQEIATLARTLGNPTNGELVYRRNDLACLNCHAIGGVGGKVGPDMTSLGASAPIDYLVESIFEPNAKIKEGYHSVVVITDDDQIFTGIETDSTNSELVLRNVNDKLIRIPQGDIIGKKPGNSLMPLGVVDRLSKQEKVDLISFLSQLGKPGDFDASQGGVARTFEVYAGTHRREQAGAEKITNGEITEDWVSLPCRVNGDLPKKFIADATKQPFNISLVNVYLKTDIEVTQAGEASFVTPTTDASFWLDNVRVKGAKGGGFTMALAAGKHSVIVRLDARSLPEVFRLESPDVAFIGN